MQTIRTTDHAPSRRDVFRAGTVAGAATFFTSNGMGGGKPTKAWPPVQAFTSVSAFSLSSTALLTER